MTLRYLSRLRHIGIGSYYIGTRITLLIAGPHIRVVDEDGTLIRELTIDPTRDYQPLGTPSGRPKSGTMSRDRWAPSPETSQRGARGIRTLDTSFPVYRISNAAPSAN